MRKENDLSDMTYALCVGNREFRQFFLDFFFRDSHLNAEEIDIYREWKDNAGNRPDFYIIDENDKRHYFVEVKLWDGNLHFNDYRKSLDELNSRGGKSGTSVSTISLGYIAAYKIDKTTVDERCSVHTWLEFYTELKKLSFLNDSAIRGYGKFLCSVAGLERADQSEEDVKKYEIFSTNDFINVRSFMEGIDAAIAGLNSIDVYAYNRGTRNIIPGIRIGRFFEVKNCKDDKPAWGWIGAFYALGKPEVCVWFEDRNGWGKFVCDKCRDLARQGFEIERDSEGVYFYMLDSDVRDSNLDIKSFLERVVAEIRNDKIENKPRRSEQMQSKYEFILAMRRFPLWLERKFLNVEIKGCSVDLISAGGDSEDPYNHCGRYFTVKQEQGEGQLNCWVGVLFGENEEAIDKPRIELQVQKEGKYKCVAALGDNNANMNSISCEFKQKLSNYCRETWQKEGGLS